MRVEKGCFYTALCTLLDRRHLVQTFIFLVSPLPRSVLTVWRLMCQRLRVCRFEWLTLFPVVGPRPQRSQCLDMVRQLPSCRCGKQGEF